MTSRSGTAEKVRYEVHLPGIATYTKQSTYFVYVNVEPGRDELRMMDIALGRALRRAGASGLMFLYPKYHDSLVRMYESGRERTASEFYVKRTDEQPTLIGDAGPLEPLEGRTAYAVDPSRQHPVGVPCAAAQGKPAQPAGAVQLGLFE